MLLYSLPVVGTLLSPGTSSAAVMLTMQDKTLPGQREVMHDIAVEGGSKHNVALSLGFLQRPKTP